MVKWAIYNFVIWGASLRLEALAPPGVLYTKVRTRLVACCTAEVVNVYLRTFAMFMCTRVFLGAHVLGTIAGGRGKLPPPAPPHPGKLKKTAHVVVLIDLTFDSRSHI